MKSFINTASHALTVILLTALLSACSAEQRPSYVLEYEEKDRISGKIFSAHSPEVDQFIIMLQQIHAPNLAEQVNNVYADKLYFNDTLNTINQRSDILAYLQHTADNLDVYELTILDRAQSQDNIYLRWKMRMELTASGKPIKSESVGMTQLKFNDAGQVIFQQDYWDSVEALYQHLPYVGFLVKKVREKL